LADSVFLSCGVDFILDISDGQLFYSAHFIAKSEQLFPLLLALDVESCRFAHELGAAAVFLLSRFVDFFQQRLLKRDIVGDGAHR
jgi:hypothetical protein